MTPMTEDEITQEVIDIKAEALWPLWPMLPMKNRRRGEPDYPRDQEVGVLVTGRLTTVYLKNLFTFEKGKTLGEQLEGVPTATYESVEAMVRAGWIGD